jgi:hypothetical protein
LIGSKTPSGRNVLVRDVTGLCDWLVWTLHCNSRDFRVVASGLVVHVTAKAFYLLDQLATGKAAPGPVRVKHL